MRDAAIMRRLHPGRNALSAPLRWHVAPVRARVGRPAVRPAGAECKLPAWRPGGSEIGPRGQAGAEGARLTIKAAGEVKVDGLDYPMDVAPQLEAALSFYIDPGAPLPVPSNPTRGQCTVRPSALEYAKPICTRRRARRTERAEQG